LGKFWVHGSLLFARRLSSTAKLGGARKFWWSENTVSSMKAGNYSTVVKAS
jgi:hypothetical protein